MYMINNEYSISLFSFFSLWSWLEIDVLVDYCAGTGLGISYTNLPLTKIKIRILQSHC